MPRSRSGDSEGFSSLLDALIRSAPGLEDHSPLPSRSRVRSPGPMVEEAVAQTALRPHDAIDARVQTYLEEGALEAVVPECDLETVARELGLGADLSTGELERRRRAFALRNHPDRVTPQHWEVATRRMTLANMLIDLALREKRGRGTG